MRQNQTGPVAAFGAKSARSCILFSHIQRLLEEHPKP